MPIQHKLAKLTTGTPSLQPGVGGMPELTGQDVAAALGFTYGNIPTERMGVHLVLAKYSHDEISIGILEKTAARMAWMVFYDLSIVGNTKRSTIDRLAKLAVADFCFSGSFTRANSEALAKEIRVSHYTWRRRYSKVYNRVINTFGELEGPVLRAVSMALSR